MGTIAAGVYSGYIGATFGYLTASPGEGLEGAVNGFILGAAAGLIGGLPAAVVGSETVIAAFISYVGGGALGGAVEGAGGALQKGNDPFDGGKGTKQTLIGTGIGAAVGVLGFAWQLGMSDTSALDLALAVAGGVSGTGSDMISSWLNVGE